MTLSLTTLAVTVGDADAYATSRGMADWTGDSTAKTAALRRGQDYIAGEYNARWIDDFENAAAPDAVKYAIFEAALREIKVPFSLTPDIVPGREKVLTEVKGIRWELLQKGGGAKSLKPVLTSIDGLLAGLVTGLTGRGGTSFVERA